MFTDQWMTKEYSSNCVVLVLEFVCSVPIFVQYVFNRSFSIYSLVSVLNSVLYSSSESIQNHGKRNESEFFQQITHSFVLPLRIYNEKYYEWKAYFTLLGRWICDRKSLSYLNEFNDNKHLGKNNRQTDEDRFNDSVRSIQRRKKI